MGSFDQASNLKRLVAGESLDEKVVFLDTYIKPKQYAKLHVGSFIVVDDDYIEAMLYRMGCCVASLDLIAPGVFRTVPIENMAQNEPKTNMLSLQICYDGTYEVRESVLVLHRTEDILVDVLVEGRFFAKATIGLVDDAIAYQIIEVLA